MKTFLKHLNFHQGPKVTAGELGFLFIQLEYQPEAERIKVLVRKGHNILGKASNTSFQISQPGIKQ